MAGRAAEDGFLGRDERLADVIAADAESLARLGVTHEQLADALDYVLDSAIAQQYDAFVRIRKPIWVQLTDDVDELRAEESEAARARMKDEPAALKVDDRYRVDIAQYLGSQHYPWWAIGECTVELKHASIDWTITNTSGAQLSGPGLISHLIRSDHFFEGRTGRYRVKPIELAQLLELGKPVRAGERPLP